MEGNLAALRYLRAFRRVRHGSLQSHLRQNGLRFRRKHPGEEKIGTGLVAGILELGDAQRNRRYALLGENEGDRRALLPGIFEK